MTAELHAGDLSHPDTSAPPKRIHCLAGGKFTFFYSLSRKKRRQKLTFDLNLDVERLEQVEQRVENDETDTSD